MLKKCTKSANFYRKLILYLKPLNGHRTAAVNFTFPSQPTYDVAICFVHKYRSVPIFIISEVLLLQLWPLVIENVRLYDTFSHKEYSVIHQISSRRPVLVIKVFRSFPELFQQNSWIVP